MEASLLMRCTFHYPGMVDPAQLLISLEEEIGSLKEEAFSRKDIVEKIEKWMAFREEENWLEEYSKVRHWMRGICMYFICMKWHRLTSL